MTNTIMWYRRDLRLADHQALAAALAIAAESGGRVVPLFVVDPVLWGRSGANRRWFLHGCLETLDADLRAAGGVGLTVRHGDPATVVPALAAEHDAAVVVYSQDVGPYGRRRDREVAAALEAAGRELRDADSNWAVSPGTVSGATAGPFKVYSAYRRAWLRRELPAPLEVPPLRGLLLDGGSDPMPEKPRPTAAQLPDPGEDAAHRQLDRFLRGRVDEYAQRRDVPGVSGTSGLSPYLRFGCVHPRQILDRLDHAQPGHEAFASELAWRDFYADVLHHWPESAWTAWNPAMSAVRTDRGPVADERFAAWCVGQTGYPIVDAGMRQLVKSGWMHNRVRMITASFLVKDLHLDWQRGARFFMDHLVDGDLPSNNHGWQWVAGCGTDAAPYHRIFSLTRQGERFDPDGSYVRQWVPELADRARVPDSHVHEPWRAPGGPPNGYPSPIVDHATERLEALARFAARRGTG